MNKREWLKQHFWSIVVGLFAAILAVGIWTLAGGEVARLETISGDASHSVSRFANLSVVLLFLFSGFLIFQFEYARERISKLNSKVNIDQLTKLVNRLGIEIHLEKATSEAVRGRGCTVFYLDLDKFKKINDTYGHDAGDVVLRTTSDRLLACVRGYDTVARFGGDEFVILLPGLTEIAAIIALAKRMIESINQNILVDGHEVHVGASIGIAGVNKVAIAPSDLLRQADVALSRCKADDGNNFRFYEPEMETERARRKLVEADLAVALSSQQLELYYQPIIDLKRNAVSSFEALIRWNHPERGLVPPDEFIQLAEQTGLIIDIGAWVLQQACKDIFKLSNAARVAVNISAVQMRNPEFITHVIRALAASGLPANRLELEITETVISKGNESTIKLLRHLKSLGLRVTLDDFGVGYSSLTYLKSIDFDKIKVDRSFVKNVEEFKETAILKALTGLTASLGMVTTVEGVETEAQLRRAKELACDEVQGFYFSKPKPLAELLVERSRRAAPIKSVA